MSKRFGSGQDSGLAVPSPVKYGRGFIDCLEFELALFVGSTLTSGRQAAVSVGGCYDPMVGGFRGPMNDEFGVHC